MSDQDHRRYPRANNGPPRPHGPDFAARMARAEFGRHYIDTGRVEQSLEHGEIIFRHRKLGRPENT